MAAVGEVGLSAGTIRYEDVGRGPVLLFVHGLLVNGLLWRMPVCRNVTRRGVRRPPAEGYDLQKCPESSGGQIGWPKSEPALGIRKVTSGRSVGSIPSKVA